MQVKNLLQGIFIRGLMAGKFYYVRFSHENIQHIFIVHGLRSTDDAYNCTCIASTSHLTWDTLPLDYYAEELKEISKSDLPLYIGWPKISPQFKDYI
jgi:hypothetical protein